MRFGISTALVTPFAEDGSIDLQRLALHAERSQERGCSSVTVFGTTGEGPSVPASERDRVASELVSSGLAAGHVVEAVIACSVEEAAWSTGRAIARGVRAVLLAPPFYFRNPEPEAVFAWYAEVFRSVGRSLRDIILYHIPSMTGVYLSPDLVTRLRREFPGAILGVKDSGCDSLATMALLEAHRDLIILVGDETYLGSACAAGASGSICGLANIVPEAVIRVAENGSDDDSVGDLVRAVTAGAVIPMIKSLLADLQGDPGWARVRPPLQSVRPEEVRRLRPLLDRLLTA